MQIVETKLKYKRPLTKRTLTEWLILHHAKAKTCSAEDIHIWHQEFGWSGFGYHYLVRKNGTIETGRPIEMIGSHTKGHNHYSIGICFEGDFDEETMSENQIQAGQEIIQMVKELYPDIKFCMHKDAWGQKTSCPGKNFPVEELLEEDKISQHKLDAFEEAYTAGLFTDYEGWKKELEKPMESWAVMRMILNAMEK